jgi:hypothetical protein
MLMTGGRFMDVYGIVLTTEIEIDEQGLIIS